MLPIIRLSRTLREGVDALSLNGVPGVSHVYNPLDYAREPHEAYLSRFGRATQRILLLGMNPGPWGMAQTGVPFGEVTLVRTWLGLDGSVKQPASVHPKRPIQGFLCTRSEVSGARLWGWAKSRFTTPDTFFAEFFVWNYCPLSFMAPSGANITPDKLPRTFRDPLEAVCLSALRELLSLLKPRAALGIGKFAEARLRAAGPDLQIGGMPHPSPASPAANRGWDQLADAAIVPFMKRA